MADKESLPEYLSEDFDANKLTINEMCSILSRHEKPVPPTRLKKQAYVDLFQKEILGNLKEIRENMLSIEPSLDGIEMVGDHQDSKENDVVAKKDIKSTVISRRKVLNPKSRKTEPVADSKQNDMTTTPNRGVLRNRNVNDHDEDEESDVIVSTTSVIAASPLASAMTPTKGDRRYVKRIKKVEYDDLGNYGPAAVQADNKGPSPRSSVKSRSLHRLRSTPVRNERLASPEKAYDTNAEQSSSAAPSTGRFRVYPVLPGVRSVVSSKIPVSRRSGKGDSSSAEDSSEDSQENTMSIQERVQIFSKHPTAPMPKPLGFVEKKTTECIMQRPVHPIMAPPVSLESHYYPKEDAEQGVDELEDVDDVLGTQRLLPLNITQNHGSDGSTTSSSFGGILGLLSVLSILTIPVLVAAWAIIFKIPLDQNQLSDHILLAGVQSSILEFRQTPLAMSIVENVKYVESNFSTTVSVAYARIVTIIMDLVNSDEFGAFIDAATTISRRFIEIVLQSPLPEYYASLRHQLAVISKTWVPQYIEMATRAFDGLSHAFYDFSVYVYEYYDTLKMHLITFSKEEYSDLFAFVYDEAVHATLAFATFVIEFAEDPQRHLVVLPQQILAIWNSIPSLYVNLQLASQSVNWEPIRRTWEACADIQRLVVDHIFGNSSSSEYLHTLLSKSVRRIIANSMKSFLELIVFARTFFSSLVNIQWAFLAASGVIVYYVTRLLFRRRARA